MRLAASEYTRFTDQLRELSDADWSAPTCCSDWDVRLMTCHVLGMAEFAASSREKVRQMLAAKRAGGLFIDALTAGQVAKHADRRPAELVAAMERVGPRAAAGRRRLPALVRRGRIADQPVAADGSVTERWTLGYLNDVILTRDTWMHRSDVAAAVGRPLTLTPEHDGVLIAHIAEEWAQRHGQSCTLVLDGPAGGAWTWGSGAPTYTLDAVEFARIISGRGAGAGLLTVKVPF
jgi:uncharacterized protein (TIGR03083 family)